MNYPNFRKLHRQIAPILFLPLALSALTGVIYSVVPNWFGVPEKNVEFIIEIHEGRFLGKPLVPFYVLLVGLGLIGLIITGGIMVSRYLSSRRAAHPNQSQPKDWRWWHRLIAPILLLPLLTSAITGIGYRLGRAWFNLPKPQAEILLEIHQGEYFGSLGKVIYVALIGIGLLVLLITGINLTGIFRRRPSASS